MLRKGAFAAAAAAAAGSAVAVGLWETKVFRPTIPNQLKAEEKVPFVAQNQGGDDRSLRTANAKAHSLVSLKMAETGSPGMVVAVSVDGEMVWKRSFGYADLENRVKMNPDQVSRIGSISKSITSVAVAKLYEDGHVDLDAPVTSYVKSWPSQHQPMTLRQLLSHTAGIRHYRQNDPDQGRDRDGNGDENFKEFYLNRKFGSVDESLELFKDSPLVCEPGKEFNYTTHGYTVVSAVVEGATGVPFAKYMRLVFKDLGLRNTYLDENEPIIPNRARYYKRNKGHKLENAPCVDNSYKWAGGGFLSTVGDLAKFGNAMLYSFQSSHDRRQGYLKPSTARLFWTPVAPYDTKEDRTLAETYKVKPPTMQDQRGYALGWQVVPPVQGAAFCRDQKVVVSHTGGSVGASSVLLILPTDAEAKGRRDLGGHLPRGVVVAIMCNMSVGGLLPLALEIATCYKNLPLKGGQSHELDKKPKAAID